MPLCSRIDTAACALRSVQCFDLSLEDQRGSHYCQDCQEVRFSTIDRGCSFRAQMISTGIDLPLPERLAQFRLPTSIKTAVLPVNLFTGDFRPCLNPSPLPPIAVCGTAGGSEVLSRMVFVQACAGCPKVYG